jgi:D-3-phosphoglycerate dehydrogenase
VVSGRLKAYVCDFPSPRFAGQAGIVALPHLGASTEEAEEASAAMVIDQLRDFLEEGTVRNAVNFPAVKCRANRRTGWPSRTRTCPTCSE